MTHPSDKVEIGDDRSSMERNSVSTKCTHQSIIASLDFKTFVILPGTVNRHPDMIPAPETEIDSTSRSSSPHLSLLDSDQEHEFHLESSDSVLDPLEPGLDANHRLSASPSFYHPAWMPHFHPEFPFLTMPIYPLHDGTSDGWGMMRIKKKKKAGKYKKKNKLNETVSPKAKKKNKKKLKKKERAEEFDSMVKWSPESNKHRKYYNKSKNRRHAAWVHRRTRNNDDSHLWLTGGEFRVQRNDTMNDYPMNDYIAPDERSRASSSSTSDWSTGGSFSGSPMAIRRPDWLNPTTPLPLYAQVF